MFLVKQAPLDAYRVVMRNLPLDTALHCPQCNEVMALSFSVCPPLQFQLHTT
jgi:hypothetical protein